MSVPEPGQPRAPIGRAALRVAQAGLWLAVAAAVAFLLWQVAGRMAARGASAIGIDPRLYLEAATSLASGALPYRDFAFEYPPLALLAMALPLLAQLTGPLDAERYAAALALQNALLVGVTAACLGWLARRHWSAHGPLTTMLLYGLLCAATPVLLWRFDALPALATVVALVAAAAGRPALTGLALGLGVATKLYPLVLLPHMLWREIVARRRAAAARLLAGTVALLIVTGLSLALAIGPAGFSFLAYHADRGVQIESLAGSLALLIDRLGGPAAQASVGFGSYQVESPMLPLLTALQAVVAVAMAGALALSTLVAYRAETASRGEVSPSTHVAHLVATLLLALLAYRVLSPQFLAWLLPLAALLPRPKVLLLLVAAALSLYVYPLAYDALINVRGHAVAALVVRNALLLALFAWLVAPGLMAGLRGARQGALGSR